MPQRDLATRAAKACALYEAHAAEISRLTSALGAIECPREATGHGRLDSAGSHFRSAIRELESAATAGRLRWPRLDDIAERVQDCRECSEVVRLIRQRRLVKRAFAADKRRIRQIGKLVLAAGAETQRHADVDPAA